MNIIIPLAGLGERFQKEGYTVPKPLIPVLGKPILFYVLDNVRLQPEDKVYILYNSSLKDHNFTEIVSERYPHVHLIEMPSTRGAAETIQLGIERILEGYSPHSECVLMDGDTFYTQDVLEMIRSNSDKNAVFYTHNEESSPIYSYITMNEGGQIQDIREKEKISHSANTGIYYFADIHTLHTFCKHVITADIRFRGEFYTSCVISEMLKAGHAFYGKELGASAVFSLGTPKQVDTYVKQTFGFLFDLDGTLVNTDHIYFDVWKQILSEHNIALTTDIFNKYIRGNSDSYVHRTLLSHDTTPLKTISSRKDELTLEYLSELTEIPGAVDFVKRVYRDGHKVAIVTNCNREVAEAVLKYTDIAKYIDILVIGSECKNPKPYSDPYQNAVEYLNLNTEKCFVFEDSKTGILSGMGIQPKCIVGIETNYTGEELIKSGVQLSLKDYTDPDSILQKLFSYTNNILESVSKYVQETLAVYSNDGVMQLTWTPTKLKGGYISDVLAFEAKGESSNLFSVIKLENQNGSYLSKMANKLGLYEREYYFYEAISKYVNIGIPKFYGLVKTPRFKNVGILLENLSAGCDLALDLNKESVDVSLKVIDSCAKLHAKFWNVDLLESFPLLKKNNDPLFRPTWSEYVQKQWPEFKERWSFMMTPQQTQVFEQIIGDFSSIQENLSNHNLTLVHGDVKSGNIFYGKTDRKPYFLDWQYVAIGKGVQDLVFFMIESFDKETIGRYHSLFKQYYYIKLLEYGVTEYSWEEYDTDFKNAIKYYPFFVAIWFGTTPEDDLIDKNFPFFFIQKLLNFLQLDTQGFDSH
jgi:HAD superfamily hydrolase (TIGR01509 family)